MFTQPKQFCCLFDLDTGSLILAMLGFLCQLGATTSAFASSTLGVAPGVKYSVGVISLISTVMNIWFLLGTVKGKANVVRVFPAFIVVQAMISATIIITLTILITNIRSTACSSSQFGTSCLNTPSHIGIIAIASVLLLLIFFISLHGYFTVRCYARQLWAQKAEKPT
ncbi:hypothetical protein DSO57_1002855 [Entomophthora muscae]|uniref:Uncharacterized protein n=1 Tax=Entomophthora muscae TaxID=34485 RepID=A0ACC2TW62_9FUNG|nr:hypothetical protein DSO57_1002855 [Entomophthora muscae]